MILPKAIPITISLTQDDWFDLHSDLSSDPEMTWEHGWKKLQSMAIKPIESWAIVDDKGNVLHTAHIKSPITELFYEDYAGTGRHRIVKLVSVETQSGGKK